MNPLSVARGQVEKFQKRRQHHQEKADEHNDAIFLIAMVAAGTIDTVSLLAPFTGPGAIVVPFATGLGTFFINGYFWAYRRDTLTMIDHMILGALTINEFMPISSALPTAIVNIAYRWTVSRQAAEHDRSEAEQYEMLTVKEKTKLRRLQQAQNAAMFALPDQESDTGEEEEPMQEAA
ncbi:hypothetical protein HY621_03080 [Candidatus Uhrbacteria bacterium]|nr:hypothetical protein [Candidatus Uhrbacteria bacterium]